jgi:hypothetical protein
MQLLGDRVPEEVRQFLDPMVACPMETTSLDQGTVTQAMRHRMMALFRAPLAHEESPCWGGARHSYTPRLKGRVT